MALINCPECGKEISDAARKCPNCGYGLKQVNVKRLLKIIVMAVLVIVAAAAVYYFLIYTPQQIPLKAAEMLAKGDYINADKFYARLGADKENVQLREELYYESRIVNAAKAVQENLIFPDSMMISEVVIWHDEVLNEAASTDTKEVYAATEPEILLHYLAKSKGGSMVDGFVRVNWKNGEYVAGKSFDDLETESTMPWYIEEGTSEALEFWQDNLAKLYIEMDLLERAQIGVFDVERCNEVLTATFGKKVDIIPSGDLIVTPSPRIVQVTPKP